MSTDNTSQKSDSLGIIFDVPKTPKGDSSSGKSTSSDPNNSHLSSHGDVFDVTKVFQSNHGEAGTIISDRRRHRQSIGVSLKKAFEEWWSGAKISVEKAVDALPKTPQNEPTVPKAETRAEIVKEAVKHSAIAPKDDHKVVLEQFHTLKGDVARMSGAPHVVIKEPTKKNTSGLWSRFTKKESPVTPSQQITVEPLDLRSSMIAPDIARKIKTDIRDFVPQAVPQEKPVPKIPVVGRAEPERIAIMPIPEVVPRIETPVPQENLVTKAPVVVKAEPVVIPPTTAPRTPPQPLPREQLPQPVFVTPSQSSAKPLSTSPRAEKPIPDISTSSITEARTVATPAPVKPPQEERRREEPVLTRTIEPIQTSSATHVFHTTRPHAQEERRAKQRDDLALYLSLLYRIPRTAWLAIGGVVLGVILIAGGIGVYVSFFKSAPTQTYSITSFFSVDTPVGIPLTEDRSAFHSVFTEQLSASGARSVQVYPTLKEGESLRPATSREFFATLAMHLPRTLENTLDSGFMIGGITTTSPEPFLIIRSYNFDELFAGLLEWEDTMPEDLSPLFGESMATSTHFIDAVQNNKSTRILYDTTGNEVLLYSFINQNVVIITTSGEALSALIEEF